MIRYETINTKEAIELKKELSIELTIEHLERMRDNGIYTEIGDGLPQTYIKE